MAAQAEVVVVEAGVGGKHLIFSSVSQSFELETDRRAAILLCSWSYSTGTLRFS